MLQVIHDYMSDPQTAWQICSDGKFVARGDAPTEMKLDYTGGCIVTERGALRVTVNAMTRLAPSEALTREDGLWIQGALFCLPSADCAMSRRGTVTELGHDPLAARPEDRAGILFDLGTGGQTLDICVRTTDPALCRRCADCFARALANQPARTFRWLSTTPRRTGSFYRVWAVLSGLAPDLTRRRYSPYYQRP
jgi:hypothetical protein